MWLELVKFSCTGWRYKKTSYGQTNFFRQNQGDYRRIHDCKESQIWRPRPGETGHLQEGKTEQAFQAQTKKIPGANRHAKIFKDAIDPHRKGFEDSTMWSRLISTFMHQFDTHGAFDFSALEPFDIKKIIRLRNLWNWHRRCGGQEKVHTGGKLILSCASPC